MARNQEEDDEEKDGWLDALFEMMYTLYGFRVAGGLP
jgi:hypothetical protein